MLKVVACLPEACHFQQIQSKGVRYQWADKSTDSLRILAPNLDPWNQEWEILIRLEQGKTRVGATYPKRLNLICFPLSGEELIKAQLVRERWKGNFAHSSSPTLLFFAFPVWQRTETDHGWLMLSVVKNR